MTENAIDRWSGEIAGLPMIRESPPFHNSLLTPSDNLRTLSPGPFSAMYTTEFPHSRGEKP